ncbi:MAG: hypothetical protein ABF290_10645 [Thiogranum sp.]
MGDRSSRRVMVIAALAAGITGLVTRLLDSAGGQVMKSPWTYALLFTLIAVFHSGVRLRRKIDLVDMATQETRSTYVAVSNTVTGVAMPGGGVVGVLPAMFHVNQNFPGHGGGLQLHQLRFTRRPRRRAVCRHDR